MGVATASSKSETADAVREFQTALWPATVANALRTPFYRELYRDFDLDSLTLVDLERLPLVTKSDIRNAGEAARYRDRQLCDEIFTGGTTGESFVTLKGWREQAYIRAFYRNVFEDEWGRPFKRALQINNPYHGHLVAIPVPMYSHKIGIYDAGSFAYGRRLLGRVFEEDGAEDRCTLLVGLERALRAFTFEAERGGEGPPDHALQAIISYSQYLTPSWRRRHQDVWGCPVIDRFGMSEVFGGATEDPNCGWYFFDPVSLPEVLDPASGAPIAEGRGELVLTALYPFQEVQPLIRYRTGDLVEVTHSRSSRPGRLAIKPLGRMRYGVRREPEASTFLLTPCEILDVLDEIEGIARISRFRDSPQVSDPFAIGHPLYSTQAEHHQNRVVVTLSVAPAAGCSETTLVESIRDGLCRRSEGFAAAVEDGSAVLDIRVTNAIAADLISHAD